MDALPVVRLKIERRSKHPWIYQKMVERPQPRPRPGALVDIVDRSGTWVGRGFYNGHSRIALRVLSERQDEPLDAAFFAQRIRRAIALRREVLGLDAVTDAYRLVHAEGDALSGLVIDRFGDVLVTEFFAAGMWRQRELIRRVLDEAFPGARHYQFAQAHVQKQESFDCQPQPAPEPVLIREHGLSFHAAPGGGHKTGFFADQRDNRVFLSTLVAGKQVVDLCCNSGGFAIHAARGGAAEVIGIDLDAEVLGLAESNARRNRVRVRFVQADLFPWLREAASRAERFDVVVLDPAKMTRDREQVIPALKKYLDMNRLALGILAPGGLLLSCSCTGLVSEEQFLDMLRRAGHYAGRTLQVFKVAGAAPDHPFCAHVPESRYLKAVYCRVD